jgi:hypothetical protein
MHKGTFSETDDQYTPTVKNCPLSFSFPPSRLAYVEDMIFIPSNISDVKSALMDYGAVATTMFFNTSYDPIKYKYYDSNIDSNDSLYPHCVAIVGWNDTIAFSGAPANGAWIIKDSYGTSWANNGYFYCSFYDAGILGENVVFPVRYNIPTSQNNSNLYAYDEFGWVDNYGFSSQQAYALTKYTISPSGGVVSPQQIKRIGTYVTDDNTILEIDLYREKNGNTLSNHIVNISDTCEYKGFYTYQLNLNSDTIGSDIYIKVKYHCLNGFQKPIPIETYEANHTSAFVPTYNSSWISSDGANWQQIGSTTPYNFDVCIKMYTENASYAVIGELPDSSCLFSSVVLSDVGSLLKDSINWYIDDVYSGNAQSLPLILNAEGLREIKLISYLGYNSDTTIKNIFVNPLPVKPTITQYGDSIESSLANAYEWLDNMFNPLPNGNDKYFIPPYDGDYYVKIYDMHFCSNISDVFNYTFTNTEFMRKENINIYPNPSDDVIYISVDKSEYRINIINEFGQIILSEENITSIDMSKYSAGIYTVNIIAKDNIYKQKVFVY